MNIIETIRAEIERRWEEAHSKYKETADQYYDGMCTALDHLETFLDTLEESEESVDADREEIIGLSIMAYLETHLKHDKSVVLRGVNKVDAREWIRRQIEREKSEKPINLDLEKEIASFITQFGWGNTKHLAEKELINCTARHFAEWGYLRAAEKYNEIEYNRQRASGSSEKPNNHEGLDEAAEEYYKKAKKHLFDNSPIGDCRHAFKAGAKWQAEQLLKSSPLPEDTVLFNKGVEEGKRLMMEEAVEGRVAYYLVRTACDEVSYTIDYPIGGCPFKKGDKVKLIIIKEDAE